MCLVLSGIEKEILKNPSVQHSKALEEALVTQSVFQFGLLEKTVDDWADWKMWMGNCGGIGTPPSKSWE